MNKPKKADTLRDTEWYVLDIGEDAPILSFIPQKRHAGRDREKEGIKKDNEGFTIFHI